MFRGARIGELGGGDATTDDAPPPTPDTDAPPDALSPIDSESESNSSSELDSSSSTTRRRPRARRRPRVASSRSLSLDRLSILRLDFLRPTSTRRRSIAPSFVASRRVTIASPSDVVRIVARTRMNRMNESTTRSPDASIDVPVPSRDARCDGTRGSAETRVGATRAVVRGRPRPTMRDAHDRASRCDGRRGRWTLEGGHRVTVHFSSFEESTGKKGRATRRV